MARCNSCNGIITKTDLDCYICGDPVPGAKRAKFAFLRFLTAAPAPAAKGSRVTELIVHRNQNASQALLKPLLRLESLAERGDEPRPRRVISDHRWNVGEDTPTSIAVGSFRVHRGAAMTALLSHESILAA